MSAKCAPARLSRRGFLRLGGAGVLALPVGLSLLAEACATAPQAATPSGGSGGAGSEKLVYPTYVPSTAAAKPDLPGTPEGVEDAYIAYPSQRTQLNLPPPGKGGELNAFVFTSTALPKPVEQNPTWQEFNKRLNVDLKLNITTDPTTKLPLIIASNDLPDTIYVPPGPSNITGFPDFLAARCADLTPYLAGDAVKTYPNLANFPPFLWKSSGVVFGDKIYGIPIARSPVGKGLMFHKELAGPVAAHLPTSAIQSAEFAQVAHAAELSMIPLGIEDPTATLYSPSDGKIGPAARQAMRDGLTAIVSGRQPLSSFDQLVADWRTSAGDTIRAELTSALAASRR
jgi:putative aldouronate transport system substrate-binding protein